MTGFSPLSWGRALRVPQTLYFLNDRHADLPPRVRTAGNTCLAFGNGRSYGDSCLNAQGELLMTRGLDRFLNFDPETGLLVCESGVLLADILRLFVPQGWFLPVTPGTRYVTVGGGIANDVHGKNHHVAGTFGMHVERFELLRSDGTRLTCSRADNPGLFAATIGGLGLTGLITWVALRLRRIANPWIDAETVRFRNLDGFFELSDESDRDYEYTVSWIDCSGRGKRLGRGLFMRGNHAPSSAPTGLHRNREFTFPFVPPLSLVNPLSLKIFNTLYYHKQLATETRVLQHYEPFFYPLDGILEWNRMYGPKGFFQYQCAIPMASGREATAQLLEAIGRSGLGSFLAVLKRFGSPVSPGLMSFPLHGVTLALDFPNRGPRLHALFERLDAIVRESGGRLYPAKDGRMDGSLFRAGYPQCQAFSEWIDPGFSSSFWRRVMESS